METWILILAFVAAMGLVHWCQRVLQHLTHISMLMEKIVALVNDAQDDTLPQVNQQQT
jgi:hypothetical protein